MEIILCQVADIVRSHGILSLVLILSLLPDKFFDYNFCEVFEAIDMQ